MFLESILANKWLGVSYFHSNVCQDMRKVEYDLISRPRGISIEEYATSCCSLTAEMIRYLLTGTDEVWRSTKTPRGQTFYVVVSRGDHEFVIHDGRLYDSWWGEYTLSNRQAPQEMIDSIREGKPFFFTRVSDQIPFLCREYESYEVDSTHINSGEIMRRYHHLVSW